MSKIKHVFFDFDSTISISPSWLYITEALGGDVEEHKRVHKDFSDDKLSYQDAVDKISNLVKSNDPVSQDKFKKACDTIPIRPNVTPILKYLSDKYTIGLISSSYDICLHNLSDKHDITNILADTITYWDLDGNFLTFSYTKDWGEWEIKRMREFCKDNNLILDNIAFVGDGDNDLELFKNIKKSFCMVTESNEHIQKIAPNVISDFEELKGYL